MLMEVHVHFKCMSLGGVGGCKMKGTCPLHATISRGDRGTRRGAVKKTAGGRGSTQCIWLLGVCLDLNILSVFA